MPDKTLLEELYQSKGMSIERIAATLAIPRRVVDSALKAYKIALRSRSETAYLQHNKSFAVKPQLSPQDLVLYGLGMGLYWGEGNKSDEYSVRLGNTDPYLITTFVTFLKTICGVKEQDIRFGLQVFNDSDPVEALEFWMRILDCKRESFHRTVSIIPSQGKGTYRRKNRYGVVQVYVANKRLKAWLMNELKAYAAIAQG